MAKKARRPQKERTKRSKTADQTNNRQHLLFAGLLLALLLLLPKIGLPHGLLGQTSQSTTVTVSATVPGPPPTTTPTITQPTSGTYATRDITIAGDCDSNLFVKVFSNNVFVGSTHCSISGQFFITTSLFLDQNVLKAYHYDLLDQAGPASAAVTINIVLPPPSSPAKRLRVPGTSTAPLPIPYNRVFYPVIHIDYSYRLINPHQVTSWQVKITNGRQPYSLHVSWGDDASSQYTSNNGIIVIRHSYATPGNYDITLSVIDASGTPAKMQIGLTVNGPLPSKQAPQPAGSAAAPDCSPSSFWRIFTGHPCSFNMQAGYILVPLYWLALVLVVILWVRHWQQAHKRRIRIR